MASCGKVVVSLGDSDVVVNGLLSLFGKVLIVCGVLVSSRDPRRFEFDVVVEFGLHA